MFVVCVDLVVFGLNFCLRTGEWTVCASVSRVGGTVGVVLAGLFPFLVAVSLIFDDFTIAGCVITVSMSFTKMLLGCSSVVGVALAAVVGSVVVLVFAAAIGSVVVSVAFLTGGFVVLVPGT